MKKIISIIISLTFLFSCNQDNKNERKVIQNVDSIKNATKKIKINTVKKTEKITDSIASLNNPTNKSKKFYDSYPEVLKKFENKYFKIGIGSFNCSDIKQFYDNEGKLNTESLFKIDSIVSNKLFGNNKSEDYGTYTGSYLYSLEKPILNFYPITVIRMFGVAESPILLVLFDKNGKYINSIEVAGIYGEIGGCMNSFFINDSTLVREYKLDNLDENENYYTTKDEDKVIIHKNGTFTVIEKDSLSKEISSNLYQIKINNKDTIVDIDYFTPENFGVLSFSHPKLTKGELIHPKSSLETNILKIYNDTLSVIIKEIKYDKSKHKFKEIPDKSIVEIDNNRAYGFDFGARENEIKTEIESIKIIKGRKIINIPKKYYSNWFNPGFNNENSADIFLLPDNRIIIDFMGSDGAGAYRGGLIIKDNKVIKKLEFTGW